MAISHCPLIGVVLAPQASALCLLMTGKVQATRISYDKKMKRAPM